MFVYIVKRMIYFIPTLLIISLLSFGLSKLAPGDPVKFALGSTDQGGAGQLSEKLAGEQAYLSMAEKMGMNLPVFYCNLTSSAMPDTLFRVVKRQRRDALSSLIGRYGNWEEIQAYYQSLRTAEVSLFDVQKDSTTFTPLRVVRDNVNLLYIEDDPDRIDFLTNQMIEATQGVQKMTAVASICSNVKQKFETVKSDARPLSRLIPSFHWYGFNNQYHNWMFGSASYFEAYLNPGKFISFSKPWTILAYPLAPWFYPYEKGTQSLGFLRGEFGNSYRDKRPVSSILKDAIRWTILMNVVAIFFAYIISIPLGVETAVKKDTKFDRISTVFLFILYSLPVFWVATMLVVFVTTKEYGAWLDWFPTFGLGTIPEGASWFEAFNIRAYHLILPVFCITYGSFAYLSRQMRGGVLSVLRQDYIRTARAKGLSNSKVLWKHAFRNSLIPIITIFAYLFPAAISGSVVVEYIFSIPGMGQEAYEAIVARDYPIVFTVLMFSAILTMVGVLVADLLYAVVDPRISYSKKAG